MTAVDINEHELYEALYGLALIEGEVAEGATSWLELS